tara:strand:- start:72 stop:290 length:219 start_codon:yes stop_codon:yes gene_type:complete
METTKTELNELYSELFSCYVRFELIDFKIIRRLVVALDNKEILKSFVNTYMDKKPVHYLQIKELEKLVKNEI